MTIYHLLMLISVQGTNFATSLAVITPYWTVDIDEEFDNDFLGSLVTLV